MNNTMSIRIRPLDTIIKYFSDRASVRRVERERSDAEYELHKKKCVYLDSLQLNLNKILHNDNIIVINNDKKQGYSIMLVNNEADLNTWSEFIKKNITITIDAKSIDDITISMMDNYIGSPVKKFDAKSCEDYTIAKNDICGYIKYGQGSWILNKN